MVRVRAHTRRTKGGKTAQVRQYQRRMRDGQKVAQAELTDVKVEVAFDGKQSSKIELFRWVGMRRVVLGALTVDWGKSRAIVSRVDVNVGFKRKGLATRMYEAAAKLAAEHGLPLSSDQSRFPGAESFWAKQVAAGRAKAILVGQNSFNLDPNMVRYYLLNYPPPDSLKALTRVRAHPRRTKSGKVSNVRQFERRFKEGQPSNLGLWSSEKARDEYQKHFVEAHKLSEKASAPKRKSPIPRALTHKIRRLGAGQGREVKLSTSEVKVILNSGKYALISAGRNPDDVKDKALTDEQINARHRQLREDLVAGGYAYTGVVGHYGEEEQSFLVMVHEAERADIIKMGTKYHQESVIYGEGGHQQLIYTEGESVGTYLAGEGWREIPGAQEDYYTELTTAEGQKVRFSLNFDWDMKRKLKKAIGWYSRRDA